MTTTQLQRPSSPSSSSPPQQQPQPQQQQQQQQQQQPSYYNNNYYYYYLSWSIYILLILIRIGIGPWLLGYVHPDEFFQGGQELWFGCRNNNNNNNSHTTSTTRPWEFHPDNALRSVLPPTIVTWIPLFLYHMICKIFLLRGDVDVIVGGGGYGHYDDNTSSLVIEMEDLLSGQEVLIIPRIACSIISILLIDNSVWSLYNTVMMGIPNLNSAGAGTGHDKKNNNVPMRHDTTTTTTMGGGGGGVPLPVLIVASAWPTMVLMNRPFSNALESYLLSWLLVTILQQQQQSSSSPPSTTTTTTMIQIGSICSIGLFSRFTFIFFAFPIMIYYLWNQILELQLLTAGRRRRRRRRGPTVMEILRRLGIITLSFLVVSTCIVYCDSQFYDHLLLSMDNKNKNNNDSTIDTSTTKILSSFSSWVVVTPWNAFVYNSQVSNLNEHGLHPRWTHAFVNMFLLYGPLTVLVYLSLIQDLKQFLFSKRSSPTTTNEEKVMEEEEKDKNNNNSIATVTSPPIVVICQWTIVFGLGVLSLAPHQEPRFLLPLLVPMALIVGCPRQQRGKKGHYSTTVTKTTTGSISKSMILVVVWILFNSILFLLFGILHQGGVVPSLLTILRENNGDKDGIHSSTNKVIYFHTYMPPTFLTRSSPSTSSFLSASSSCVWDDQQFNDKDKEECPQQQEQQVTHMMHSSACHNSPLILDLKGSHFDILIQVLHEELICHEDDENKVNTTRFIQLVMPPLSPTVASTTMSSSSGGETMVKNDDTSLLSIFFSTEKCALPGYHCDVVGNYRPHLTTEDFLPWDGSSLSQLWDNMALTVYQISNSC